MFPSPKGQWTRRSNYRRNLFDPTTAAAGWQPLPLYHRFYKRHRLRGDEQPKRDHGGVSEDDKDDALYRAISWAVDHCAVQIGFGTEYIVAGDPVVLATGPPIPRDVLGDDVWTMVDLPGGMVLVIASDSDADAPHLFVTATSDGPLDEASLRPNLWTDEGDAAVVAELLLPSGRFVAGHPEVVAEWGPAVAPRTGVAAETMTGWDHPEPGRYIGPIAIAQLGAPATCDVAVVTARSGQGVCGISIRFPKPGWAKTIPLDRA